jgi:DNA mismatch repair protein MSH3
MTSVVTDKILAIVAGLPQLVVISLAHAIKYLSTFSIADAALAVKFFARFSERNHMLLNGNTMTNLFVCMISVPHWHRTS